MNRIFEVAIGRPGHPSTWAVLGLPATWAELHDALDRARITDDRIIYSVEMLSSKLPCLHALIPTSANLYELNHLSERLSGLADSEMDCFEGLARYDALQDEDASIPVERLINMTHNLGDCHVLYGAHDDAAVGKFYAENGFVPELDAVSDNVYAWLDFSTIGKELREAEHGAFTSQGYVVLHGEIQDIYATSKLERPRKPGHIFALEIALGPMDAIAEANTTTLLLPAETTEIISALDRIDSCSMQECVVCDFKSVVPQITDALFNDMGDFDQLNELAHQLKQLDERGELLTFKAMLDASPKDIPLADALDLSRHASDFRVLREDFTPGEYAATMLTQLDIPLLSDFLSVTDLEQYGTRLMAENHVYDTAYGMLQGTGGQTLEQYLEKPCESEMTQHM